LKHVDDIGGQADIGQMAVTSFVAKQTSKATKCSVMSVSRLSLQGPDRLLPMQVERRELVLWINRSAGTSPA
jgi:hypothetical protein